MDNLKKFVLFVCHNPLRQSKCLMREPHTLMKMKVINIWSLSLCDVFIFQLQGGASIYCRKVYQLCFRIFLKNIVKPQSQDQSHKSKSPIGTGVDTKITQANYPPTTQLLEGLIYYLFQFFNTTVIRTRRAMVHWYWYW